MSKIISVVNQKGGVGKTTTAINLSAALALEGVPVLLIDCDPQCNTTGGLGFAKDEHRTSTYDLLLEEADLASATLASPVERLSLVPASRHLIGANFDLAGQPEREFRLRKALRTGDLPYEFVILDCPPALDLLTLNALVASDGLLVPVQAEYFALEGISELMSTLDKVSGAFNPNLALEGVLLTMYDPRTQLSQQVTENLKSFFGEKLLKTVIPRNIRLAESPSHGLPVALYDPKSRGAEAYAELAIELLQRNHIRRRPAQSKPQTTKPAIRLWPYNQ